MRDAKLMEMTSLVLLLLVVLLSPVIILLVKNATSTIQVALVSPATEGGRNVLDCNLMKASIQKPFCYAFVVSQLTRCYVFTEFCEHSGRTNTTIETGEEQIGPTPPANAANFRHTATETAATGE